MNLKELTVKAKKLWDPNFVEDVNVAEETKANEVMNTGATGFGTELIPTNVMLDPMLDLVPNYSKLLPLLPGNHGNNMPISAKVPVIGEAELFKGNTEWTT